MENKEILEEVAEQFEYTNGIYGFKQGAKWQQEQDKNKYSEEEVIQLLIKFNQEIQEVENVRGWFEEFKKK
jgi:hypothetical protein